MAFLIFGQQNGYEEAVKASESAKQANETATEAKTTADAANQTATTVQEQMNALTSAFATEEANNA